MNSVAVTVDLRCPFSAAIEYVEIYHKERSGADVLPYAHVVRHVQCAASEIRDVTDETRVHEALLLRWTSRLPLLPPIVHGLITVRPNGRTTQMRLEATYVPRFGLFGRVIDALAGRLIVRERLHAFLNDVSRYVENAYELERMLQMHMNKPPG
ncbi:MAG TPA: hypothetical protein VFN37_08745 [Candidatus Baltobacteraceae bacterium]|nr:hypothetical protein [Candidatus Baltobacteraceae bacterium]